MADYLPRLRPAGAEAHAVNHAVETPLERAQQVLARDALHLDRFGEGVAELGFEHAIDAAHLLLFAKLQPVADGLLGFAGLPVLSGHEVAALDGTLFSVAALTLQKQFHSLAPAKPANGASI